MSWNKFKFFNTVKFKVALWYALLFILSSMICFFFMFTYLKKNLMAKADLKLESLAETVTCEYLTGNRFKRLGRQVPLSELPASHYTVFRQKFPQMTALLVFENSSSEKTYYNLIGESNGNIYLMRLDFNEQIYSLLLNTEASLPLLKKTFAETTMNLGGQNIFFRINSRTGGPLLESPNYAVLKPELKEEFPEHTAFSGIHLNHSLFRIIRFPICSGVSGVIGYNLSSLYESLDLFILIFFMVMVAVLLPGTLAGWLIARKFVSGIERVNDAALQIARGDFSKRLSEGNEEEEINDLVHSFNFMNANTENLFSELKHVTDNVAHDLRTPLTRIRTVTEITISGPQEISSYREAIIDIAEDCDSMISMINSMLEITRLETHLALLKMEEISLNQQLRQAYELFEFQAEDKQINFILSLPETEVRFSCDKLKFQRMISNLLDNALKFTPEKGTVELILEADDSKIRITVRDSGCGIPEEALPHIFKRFYRSDKSRSMPGNGLGLSMVQAIILAHNGTISVRNAPDGGTIFTVMFDAMA